MRAHSQKTSKIIWVCSAFSIAIQAADNTPNAEQLHQIFKYKICTTITTCCNGQLRDSSKAL